MQIKTNINYRQLLLRNQDVCHHRPKMPRVYSDPRRADLAYWTTKAACLCVSGYQPRFHVSGPVRGNAAWQVISERNGMFPGRRVRFQGFKCMPECCRALVHFLVRDELSCLIQGPEHMYVCMRCTSPSSWQEHLHLLCLNNTSLMSTNVFLFVLCLMDGFF